MNKKKVVMVMPHMVGGGAERVAAQIMNKLNERGYDTRFILTSAKKNEVVRSDLNEKTELILLTEEMKAETTGQKLAHLPARAYSTIFGKLYEKQGKYQEAIDVCKLAIAYRITDATKTGFEGRIRRLEKKMRK